MESFMRWFWILLIIAVIIFGIIFFRFKTVDPNRIDAGKFSLIAQSSVSLVYELNEKSWITFPIADSESVKIVSNATIRSTLPFFDSINYVLEYQILDFYGKILEKKIYNLRNGVSTFIKKIESQDFVYTNSFYLEQGVTPTDANVVVLNLEKLKDAQKIQLRLASKSDFVQSVESRCYITKKVPEYKLGYFWNRMNDSEKQKLAAGNVYSSEFLTEDEKRNALIHSWLPIGPEGILGVDYRRKELYILEQNDGLPYDILLSPAGVIIDENHEGVIPIPEPGGEIELELTAVKGTLKKDSPIQYEWFGRSVRQRQKGVIHHENIKIQKFSHVFNSGLLKISSKEKVAVRAYQVEKENKIEITPEPMYLQAFLAQQNTPVEFSVAHEDTLFKIDLRCLFSVPKNINTKDYMASFELIDSKNVVISQGDISGGFSWLKYDRIAALNERYFVSDPFSQYFDLPPEVVKIRISTKKNPILVVGYNRPKHMSRKIRVPEDSVVFNVTKEMQARWFYLKPINYADLFKESHVKVLKLQYRPRLDNADILNGRYFWEDYHPEGSWVGRYLFVPIEEALPFRQSALPSYFLPIRAEQPLLLHFKTRKGIMMEMPTLAWQREEDSPMNIRIYINQKQHYETSIAGKWGEIALPPIREGSNTFKIEASITAKFFVNYLEIAKEGYTKTLVKKISKDPLVFVYERTTTAPETLIIKYFKSDQKGTRSQISVKIVPPEKKSIGPWSEWSFLEYLFDIRSDNPGTLPVFGTNSEYVDSGQLLFIPVGTDMPLGQYKIFFELKEGEQGYLSLTKITPGFVEQRRFIEERNLKNE